MHLLYWNQFFLFVSVLPSLMVAALGHVWCSSGLVCTNVDQHYFGQKPERWQTHLGQVELTEADLTKEDTKAVDVHFKYGVC